jgi:hypothetical protein
MRNKFIFSSTITILVCIVTTAILNLQCNLSGKSYVLDRTYIENYAQLRWEQDSTLLVLAGNSVILTKSLAFNKGKYSIIFRAKGSKSKDILPHFVISLGNYTIKDMEIATGENSYTVNFELPESMNAPVKFTFDNDYSDESGDRNIFLFFPVLIKPY